VCLEGEKQPPDINHPQKFQPPKQAQGAENFTTKPNAPVNMTFSAACLAPEGSFSIIQAIYATSSN
jgi:hypothetical protein